MSLIDLINDIAKNKEEYANEDDDEEEGEIEEILLKGENETTDEKDIDAFIRDARQAAQKNIDRNSDMTTLTEETIRERINTCNPEQRLIFDDLIERFASNMADEKSVCLYIAGEAGKHQF